MSENIFEHTTSIVGLTCKPLSILSETISPQEMSRAQGGNGNGGQGGIAVGAGCDPYCLESCCQPDEIVIVDPEPQGGGLSGSSSGGDRTVVEPPKIIETAADTVSDFVEWDPNIPGPSEIVNEIADTWNDAVNYVVDFVAENYDIYLTEEAEIEAEIAAMEEEERQREEEERQRLDEEGEEDEEGLEGDFESGDRNQVLV